LIVVLGRMNCKEGHARHLYQCSLTTEHRTKQQSEFIRQLSFIPGSCLLSFIDYCYFSSPQKSHYIDIFGHPLFLPSLDNLVSIRLPFLLDLLSSAHD